MREQQAVFAVWVRRDLRARYGTVEQVPEELLALAESLRLSEARPQD